MSVTSAAVPMPRAAAERRPFGRIELALYAVTVFAWSTSWIALRNQLGVVAPEVSLVWRFLLAAVLMFGWVAARGLPLAFPVRIHGRFALMGLLMFSTNFALFYHGGQHLASGLLSVVFSLTSVFNLLLGFAIDGTRPGPRALAGALLGFAGVALLFWPEIHGQTFDPEAALGLGLCAAGTLCFCLGNQVSGRVQAAGVPVLSANAWGMAYGTLFLTVAAVARGATFTVEPNATYLVSLVWLSVVSSVVAFWAYLNLLGRIGAGRAGYATVLFPVFALIISTLFEGYRWSPPALAGLALVACGNVLVLRRR